MAIANGLSDDELIEREQRVKKFFAQAPARPDFAKIQGYKAQIAQLQRQSQELLEAEQQKKQELDTLGPARSLFFPFGAPPQDVEAAELEVRLVQYDIDDVEEKIQTAKKSLKTWDEPLKRYQRWQQSPEFEGMQESQKMLQVPAVQERLQGIRQVQERQQVLKRLQAWEAIAQSLGRPDAYIQRIREIREEFRQGGDLSDQVQKAYRQDMDAYEQQARQSQRRSQRI